MALTQVQSGMMDSIAQYNSFKNRIINGNMGISQRGTTFTNLGATAPAYGLDRWAAWRGSYFTGLSASQQTGFSGFANCYRFGRAASNTSLEPIYTSQIIESVNMLDLAGQTINLSFFARVGANFSGPNLIVLITTGTATNQTTSALSLGTWTGYSNTGSFLISPTTTAAQYTFSVAIPSNVQSMAVQFIYVPTGTAGAADYVEVTGVQLEKGSTATAFDYRPYGTELSLCQRYYVQYTAAASNWFNFNGFAYSGTSAVTTISVVPLRTAPTLALSGSGTFAFNDGAANYTVTSPVLRVATYNYDNSISVAFTATSLVAYRPGGFFNTNATNPISLTISAEL